MYGSEATVEPPTLRVEEQEDSTTYTVANLETRSLLRTIPALLVVLCSVANFWESTIGLNTCGRSQESQYHSRFDFAKYLRFSLSFLIKKAISISSNWLKIL